MFQTKMKTQDLAADVFNFSPSPTLEIPETNDSEERWFEKYIYSFDYPEVNESGYVELQPNSIVIHIPEKSLANLTNAHECSKTFRLYVNKHHVFDSTWLPIYTMYDCYKLQEMFYKCFNEYRRIVPLTNYPSDMDKNARFCDNITTVYNLSNLYIYCFETPQLTCIEINYDKNSPTLCQPLPCSFQMNIGNNMILSTKETFEKIPYISFVINFLLSKFVENII